MQPVRRARARRPVQILSVKRKQRKRGTDWARRPNSISRLDVTLWPHRRLSARMDRQATRSNPSGSAVLTTVRTLRRILLPLVSERVLSCPTRPRRIRLQRRGRGRVTMAVRLVDLQDRDQLLSESERRVMIELLGTWSRRMKGACRVRYRLRPSRPMDPITISHLTIRPRPRTIRPARRAITTCSKYHLLPSFRTRLDNTRPLLPPRSTGWNRPQKDVDRRTIRECLI